MIPLKDNVPSRTRPYLNYLFILLNAAVFAFELSLEDEQLGQFIVEYGLIPWEMTRGIARDGFSPSAHVLPWISSMFIHGGWLHFIGNMWFLWIFGDNVEDRLGKFRYLVLYLGTGLLAGLSQVISSPAEAVPMVGASGAISGVVGAYLILYPNARVVTLVPIFIIFYLAELPAFIFIGIWFALQFLNGYTSLLTDSGGVAWWAHIGGFVAGVIMVLILKIGTRDPGRDSPVRARRLHVIR